MSFLPENYEKPKSNSLYMKFAKGENRFRILSDAITGYEYWTTENKPVRSEEYFKGTPQGAKLDEGKFKQKHFWAFLVWNYENERVEILEITQATIMSSLESYILNKKWGDPKGYDMVVTATGDGLEREYTTIAEPHSPAPEADIEGIELQELFRGEDPFKSSGVAYEATLPATGSTEASGVANKPLGDEDFDV